MKARLSFQRLWRGAERTCLDGICCISRQHPVILKEMPGLPKGIKKKSLNLIGFFQGNNVICPSFSSSGSRHLNASDAWGSGLTGQGSWGGRCGHQHSLKLPQWLQQIICIENLGPQGSPAFLISCVLTECPWGSPWIRQQVLPQDKKLRHRGSWVFLMLCSQWVETEINISKHHHHLLP